MPEFILKIPTAGAKQIDFIYRKTKESKMLFHFFLIFSFLFSVIASLYVAVTGSSTVSNCLNNCTATYSESYTCLDITDGLCEDLSNPRENVTFNSQTTLVNIPCRLTGTVNNGCT